MRILILTQYFYPETGAPQNRLKSLAGWLNKSGHEVQVLTGMPNYPALKRFAAYEGMNQMAEEIDGVKVYRVNLFLAGKGFLNRLITYFSFCLNTWRFGGKTWKKGELDWVFCESPPLFLGITAYALAKRTNSKFWFNVSDLWPESVEKLGLVTNKILLAPFYSIEKWLYKKAHFITGQTQGICLSINKNSGKPCHWYPNGIALEETSPSDQKEIPLEISKLLENKVFLYSGNLGYAQGLEVILGAAEILNDLEDVCFVLLGDGPEKEKLEKLIQEKKLKNVHLFTSVPRNVLLAIIQKCQASIVPLRDIPLFHGAIPSKIFEPLALGVPVLLGVKGEAYDLFCEQNRAALFFEPEDIHSLTKAISYILEKEVFVKDIVLNGKGLVNSVFERGAIHDKLQQKLVLLSG